MWKHAHTPLCWGLLSAPPHPCQQELGPLFKGIDCPLLRPGEKRQMFPRWYQPVHYTVSFSKEEEKTPRGGKRPSPALNHRTMLHWSKSVCTCSAGLAERASPPQSARPTLNGCSAALAPFTGSSSLWLPGQIEVIQPSAGHKYNFNSVEGRKKLRTDQPGLPTINHRIRFDTLDSKAPSYWKVGPNDLRNYKVVVWMTIRKNSTWAFIKLHLIIKCPIFLCLSDTWGILNVIR